MAICIVFNAKASRWRQSSSAPSLMGETKVSDKILSTVPGANLTYLLETVLDTFFPP